MTQLLEKPIIAPARGCPSLDYVAVIDGHAIETDAHHWRRYWAGHGPDQLVPRDALDKALKVDKAPHLEPGRFIVTTKGGRSMAIPFDAGDLADFPTPPAMDPDKSTRMVLPGFAEAVQRVRYAAATNDVRYYLQGVCLGILHGAVHVIATDGHRAHIVELPAVAHDDSLDSSTLIPGDMTRHITGDIVTVGKDENEARRIVCADLSILAIDGRFPDWRRLLAESPGTWTVERDALLDYLEAYSKTLTATQRKGGTNNTAGVRLVVGGGRVTLQDGGGRDLAQLDAVTACEPYTTGVAVTYLIDLIRHATYKGGDLTVRTRPAPNASDVLRADSDTGLGTALAMPMRL